MAKKRLHGDEVALLVCVGGLALLLIFLAVGCQPINQRTLAWETREIERTVVGDDGEPVTRREIVAFPQLNVKGAGAGEPVTVYGVDTWLAGADASTFNTPSGFNSQVSGPAAGGTIRWEIRLDENGDPVTHVEGSFASARDAEMQEASVGIDDQQMPLLTIKGFGASSSAVIDARREEAIALIESREELSDDEKEVAKEYAATLVRLGETGVDAAARAVRIVAGLPPAADGSNP